MSMSSVIQVNRIYLIFNPVHFLVDSSDPFQSFHLKVTSINTARDDAFAKTTFNHI